MEKFGNSEVLIELDDSTFIFGRIVDEDGAFLTMIDVLTLTPNGHVYANKKIVVKRDGMKSVVNSKISIFRELAVERHVDYGHYEELSLWMFGIGSMLFLILAFA